MLTTSSSKSTFRQSGQILIGLLVLAIAGFWPSYYSRVFGDGETFSYYIHIHGALMLLWVCILIAQPFLIRQKKNLWHKRIGKFTYLLIPLIFIGAILLVHSTLPDDPQLGSISMDVFIPFKDLVVIGIAWGMAIYHRKNPLVHARYMICTSFAFIEPALVRLIGYAIPSVQRYLWTVIVIDLILLILIYRDRRFPKGRNIFTFFLVLYLLIQTIVFTGADYGFWNRFTLWFAGLPLT